MDTKLPRLNHRQQSPELFKKLAELGALVSNGAIEPALGHLIKIRASQLNGCAFCVDLHVKQARQQGERELRLHHLVIWRESPLFSERERAALVWTEALTRLPEHGVSDEIYESVRAQFSERELSDLSFEVLTINAWNRLGVAFKSVPGSLDQAFGLDKALLG
ncbi:MAG: carboxymuconolactone decarboxylase family protein [Pseudomonadota bacterium]